MRKFKVLAAAGLLAASGAVACHADDVNLAPAEIVARLSQSVGNIAFTPDNQMIISFHPFYSPDIRVARLTSPTTFEPFPNAAWNTPKPGTDHYLDNVLGLRSDENGVVWIIDMGFRTHITPKLVGWNTRTNSLERIYYLPDPATIAGSQPQDLVIDHKHRQVLYRRRGYRPGRRWLEGGHHRRRYGYRPRPPRTSGRAFDHSGECSDHGRRRGPDSSRLGRKGRVDQGRMRRHNDGSRSRVAVLRGP